MFTSPKLIIMGILVYKIKPNIKIWNLYYQAMFKWIKLSENVQIIQVQISIKNSNKKIKKLLFYCKLETSNYFNKTLMEIHSRVV